MKVLVCDKISDTGLSILKDAGIAVDVKLKQPEDAIVDIINEYDAVLVRSETKITKKIIEKADNLKVIGRAGVGVDNIDVEAATLKGIAVVNAPDGNTIAAAELTIAHMLNLSRHIPQANAALKGGEWARTKYTGFELKGKVLGVLGLGKIGSEVAKRARAFDMILLGYDPFISEERAKSLGVKISDLETIFKEADFITVHMPLTKETKYLISEKQLAMMKPNARIINCARGGIVEEEALCQALNEGKIAGAALDVFEREPNTDSPLFELPQVIVTPHLGASTEEAQVGVAVDVAHEVVRALNGEVIRNAVNIPSVNPELLQVLGPYLDLSEKLGKFLGQAVSGQIQKVEITYSGDLAQHNIFPLTTSFLKGLLKPTLQEGVNYVNAPHVAKARGIKVTESKTVDIVDYANLISVEVETNQGVRRVAGTIMRKNDARIVRIDQFNIDIPPQGHMLVFPHTDRPKIIGRIGTLIGEHDINIAGMQLGRTVLGGDAIAVLNIDSEVPEDTIKELKKIDGIIDVKYVYL